MALGPHGTGCGATANHGRHDLIPAWHAPPRCAWARFSRSGGGGYFFGLGQVGLQLEAVEAEEAVGGPALLPARVLGDRDQGDLAQPFLLLCQDPAERIGHGDELGLGSQRVGKTKVGPGPRLAGDLAMALVPKQPPWPKTTNRPA